MKSKSLFLLLSIPILLLIMYLAWFGISKYSKRGELCIQSLTEACLLTSSVCMTFSSPCNIPPLWETKVSLQPVENYFDDMNKVRVSVGIRVSDDRPEGELTQEEITARRQEIRNSQQSVVKQLADGGYLVEDLQTFIVIPYFYVTTDQEGKSFLEGLEEVTRVTEPGGPDRPL